MFFDVANTVQPDRALDSYAAAKRLEF